MATETKAESSSKAFDTSLLRPPPSYTVPPTPELNAAQQIKLKEIELHFSKDGFELPVMEGTTGDPEKRGLSEREMMFLVSLQQTMLLGSAHRSYSPERRF